MATIFSKIVNGEIPCHKIAENREFFAFLDIHPLVEGHTLVIPKEEIDYIFDIDDDRLGRMMAFAKKMHTFIWCLCRRNPTCTSGRRSSNRHPSS